MPINFKKQLNNEQMKVVLQGDGPCLVLAGAGSGKTRTITYRVAYLLEQGIAPDEILLVTFTNKAAKEMKNRINELTEGEIKLPWSGTFHHICNRILRRYAQVLGYQSNFTVLDSEDSRDLIKLCLKGEGIDTSKKRFPSARVILGIISYATNSQRPIRELIEEKYSQWTQVAGTIEQVRSEYIKKKKEANAMDFDDLLFNVVLLLNQAPAVAQKYSEQFKYVMVDEYQDTNKVQAALIKLFAHKHGNILVVGDDAQSIYSFRAAEISNILEFSKRYPGAKTFKLETNYRSTPNILDVANNVINNNVNQFEKSLLSIREAAVKPEVHAYADNYEEARKVADEIEQLNEDDISLTEIAVLFRAAYHSQALEMELTKRGIPYEYRGGLRFFERAHIKDTLAYLRILHNRNDIVAWGRCLLMHTGIGPATVAKIVSQTMSVSNPKDILLLEPKLSTRAQVGWNSFKQVWSILASIENPEPAELINAILMSPYQLYLKTEYQDYQDRIQDIEQLALYAETQPNLEQFLAEASLQEGNAAKQAREVDQGERLILSTIHQAKGLEWEAVFVIHLASGQFPNDRASRERGGMEEERRLFYVAITRAKTNLYMSYPLVSGRGSSLLGPSPFLEELDKRLVDEHCFSSATVFDDPSDDVDDIIYEPIEEDKPKHNNYFKASFLKSIDDL